MEALKRNVMFVVMGKPGFEIVFEKCFLIFLDNPKSTARNGEDGYKLYYSSNPK